ncbi:hypothetical protein GCM10011349_19940 [Novosphingobium indicum]|uniref:DUF4054 domain-containing protein n=1 Tax=Novosphingobium indicum TaxID=462949 RepID=A0ABQ2JLZ9_9SPHN|nr:DUF4054 domain-containing protein [Novosphingobium indicum]GGN49370.1 hypothetical protein GCM10011349_19940 [Novosphingobium indicum]
MAVAEFNYSAWTTRYPEFGAVDEALAALFFAEAGLYLDNTDASPVSDVNLRAMLLNMLTAHIAVLSGALEPDGKPSGMVGRVNSATEGGVSIGIDSGMQPGTAPWFQQTSYGLSFWQATKNLRSASYVAAPARVTEPWAGAVWRR